MLMDMKKKTIIWGIVFALILIAGLAAWLFLKGTGGTVAVISVNGEEIDRIDLTRVKETYYIDLDTGYGRNIIQVSPGAIAVTYADCPDQICVHQGQLTGGGIPIVCMPHRLVISIEGGGIDG